MDNSHQTKKPLKILMLSPTMFFADYGAHVRILEEARILQTLGHNVTILAYPNGRDLDTIKVRRCWGVPFNYRVIVGSSRHKIYLDALLAGMALWHTLRETPDIIHAHLHEGALIGWVLSRLTGAPLVFDFQGSLTGEMIDHKFLKSGGLIHKFMRWLETRIDHAADVVMPSSAHAARLLLNQFHVPASRIDPTPDCVNASVFARDNFEAEERRQLKQALGIPLNKTVIVYLGLLATYQGVDMLLQSLANLKQQGQDFHLLLMGFPAVAQYQEMAIQLGLADYVTFTGKVSYDDAPRYLSLGDIAVAPKLSATEGSGKILNYMAMSLPTVAFNVPVSREFLGDGGIYAFQVTPQAFQTALQRALDLSPDERARLGGYLRKRVIRFFSWQKAGEQIEAIYQALLAGEPLPVTTLQPVSENS